MYSPISTPETSLGKSTEYKEANIICGDLPDYVCMKPRRTSEEQEPVESPAECWLFYASVETPGIGGL